MRLLIDFGLYSELHWIQVVFFMLNTFLMHA